MGVEREMGITAYGYGVSVWDDKNVLEVDSCDNYEGNYSVKVVTIFFGL